MPFFCSVIFLTFLIVNNFFSICEYSIITELIETTLREQEGDARDGNTEAVFRSILKETGLDMKDKKAGIIDFISAGIHTVIFNDLSNLHIILKNKKY